MTAPTVVRFEPRGAHIDLMRCRDTEVVAVGRAGSGKSLAACWKLHLTALKVPNLCALMLRSTHISLTSTTLITFQRQVAAHALADGTVHWFGGSSKDPAAFRYANGSTVLVAGGDKPAKFLSAELDRIFVDEAVEIGLDLHETLISRLRGSAATYKQIMLATNPAHPSHWIKRRAEEGKLTMITSTHRDNPHYVNRDDTYTAAGAEYMTKLDALTGMRRKRLRDGQWVAAEGAIYEQEWNEGVHVIKPFPIPASWERFITVDFGFTNPFCAQWWAVDHDGRMYLYREIYHTRRLVEDHARHMLALMRTCVDCCDSDTDGHNCQTCKACTLEWTEPQPRAVICDHDAEDRATLYKHLGISTTAAKKTVTTGLQAVQARLRDAGDGKPRLFIFEGARVEEDEALRRVGKPTCTAEEIPGYVWAKKPGTGEMLKEEPLKENDHGCDCMRYAVAARDLVGRTRVRWL
jgi:phage terminase large subunit